MKCFVLPDGTTVPADVIVSRESCRVRAKYLGTKIKPRM